MKNYNILMLCLLALSLATLSCKEEAEPLTPPIDDHHITIEKEGSIVLGKKLEDPYAIENMKKAYSVLRSKKSGTADVDLQPTHTYLRFLPQSEEELGLLKTDTTLILYDFPLNYEIASMGTYYHDPSLADTAITYQYCVVKRDYVIPSVQHELLYDVLIPPDSSTTKGIGNLQQFYEELEYESVKLTGNLPKGDSDTKGLLPSKWRPKGTITYYDNSLGTNEPVVGASVHARWFVHIETDLTDANGYFQTDRFRYEVNYAIKWQRSDFDINNGRYLQAWYNGPKKKGDWNLNITGGMSRMYAIIHRAACDYYYYNNSFGIQSPPQNHWYNNRLSIGAFDWEQVDANGDTRPWQRWVGMAEIRVFKPSRDSRDIYATTIHELAHASHWHLVGGYSFAFKLDDIVAESWARGVQWEFTRNVYPGYSISYSRRDYTGIVQDMIDGNKTTVSYFYSTYQYGSYKSYSDQVNGYTLQQIEGALKGARTFNDWLVNLKNRYNNETENNLDAAFNYWAD